MKECVTHHHACACREAIFEEALKDASRYRYLRDSDYHDMEDIVREADQSLWDRLIDEAIEVVLRRYHEEDVNA